MAIKNTIVVQQVIQTFREYKEPEKSLKKPMHYTITIFFLSIPRFYVENRKITDLTWQAWNIKDITAHISI